MREIIFFICSLFALHMLLSNAPFLTDLVGGGERQMPVASQQSALRRRPLRMMTWNVENLFDTLHDEGADDWEFLPQGERRWTGHRLWRKLTDVARVVVAVGEEGGLPDCIGLCEVENDSVVHMLTRRSILRLLGYDYVMTHGEDDRGVDVALLYQPLRFRLLGSRSIRVPSKERGLRPTRDLLHAWGLVLTGDGVDTLHVMVAHLPSRTGGQEGDRNRQLAARTLWQTVDEVMQRHGSKVKVVAMGDFNAVAGDRIFRHAPLQLTDDPAESGTYCYRGFWQWLDHILISPVLTTKGLSRPVKLPWLLEPNRTYGGSMPRRTFQGPAYKGGVSDHLALTLDIVL